MTELDGPHSLQAHSLCEAAVTAIQDHAFFQQVQIAATLPYISLPRSRINHC